MGSQPGFTMPDGPNAGDVSAKDAWTALAANDRALLVDVRTKVEWSLIGTPDLTALGREPVYIQWMTAQGPNPAFLDELQAAVAARGATQDTPLYFLCQSGGRSKVSAMQCTGSALRPVSTSRMASRAHSTSIGTATASMAGSTRDCRGFNRELRHSTVTTAVLLAD